MQKESFSVNDFGCEERKPRFSFATLSLYHANEWHQFIGIKTTLTAGRHDCFSTIKMKCGNLIESPKIGDVCQHESIPFWTIECDLFVWSVKTNIFMSWTVICDAWA